MSAISMFTIDLLCNCLLSGTCGREVVLLKTKIRLLKSLGVTGEAVYLQRLHVELLIE